MSSSRSSSESSGSPAPTRKKRKVDGDVPQLLIPPEDTVLSHAERRWQKKKQKQPQPAVASSESAPKKRKLNDGTTGPPSNVAVQTEAAPVVDDPRRQERRHSVWVGNLAFRTTQDALRVFFDGVGKITRIHMPMRRGKQMDGENMGFAYVDFETSDAKVTAIALSEGQLDGRNLLIKGGDDFTGRPAKTRTGGEGEKSTNNSAMLDGKGPSKTAQKILRIQKQPPAPTLFLGNLGFETTEESIRELFEAHRYWNRKEQEKGKGVEKHEADEGEGKNEPAKSKDVWIRKIRMGTFEDSGACKGFAFVDFTSIEHATAALVNPRNHRLNGRDLVVEYASPEAVRRGGGPRHLGDAHDRKTKSGGTSIPQKDSTGVRHTKQRRPEQEMTAAATTARPRRFDGTGRGRLQTRRAKPGAALAHAQRQSAAILPSQGQKIVF